MMRPTASKAALLLACSYPWGRKRDRGVDTESAAAKFGTEFHALFAEAIAKGAWKKGAWDRVVFGRRGEVVEHASAAWPVFVAWLLEDNPWHVDLTKGPRLRAELPMALDMVTRYAHITAPHDAEHVYDVAKNELAGTADLVIDKMPDAYRKRGAPDVIIIDHKTGDHIDLPQDSAQLKTLAAMFEDEEHKVSGVVFHAARGLPPSVYEWTYSADEIEEHFNALREAWIRIGDGSMRPGEHCRFCPSLLSCPTQTSVLRTMVPKAHDLSTPEVTTLDGNMTPELLGAQHAAIQQIEQFAKRWREAAAQWIREHGPAVRPDGSLVGLVTREYENLSKASIIRALGREKGEREIQRLRKAGCLETSEREEMRVIKD